MSTARRRALLEQLAFEGDASDAMRLRALDLLDRLDEREREEQAVPTSDELTAAFADELADDFDRLVTATNLLIECSVLDHVPAFRELVERRAEAIVEERAQAARERFEVVRDDAEDDPDASEDAPEAEDVTEEPSEPSDAPSASQDARAAHPLDEVSFRLLAQDELSPPSLLSRRRRDVFST